MYVRLGLAALLLLAAPQLSISQEDLPTPKSAKPPKAAAAKGSDGDFQKLFGEWKPVLKRLRDLQVEHQTANEEERAELEKEFTELIKQGEALAPKLKTAAEAAYKKSPENEDAANFLASSAVEAMQSDNYEEVRRLTKLLIDNDFENKAILDLAGIASFEVADFDGAEDYLTQAKEHKSLSDQGKEYLAQVADARTNWEKEQKIRAKEAKADDLPRVLMKTNKGDITIELFENEAPESVANFIALVEDGFYDGVTFHRVLPGFMAQGGDPKGDGTGGPGYSIRCECYEPEHRLHYRGSLSMAHAGRDTGGSQFFLTFRPTTHLDGKHTVFGRIIKGTDVLTKLQRRDPGDPSAPAADKIVSATVLRKRKQSKYEFEKLPEKG